MVTIQQKTHKKPHKNANNKQTSDNKICDIPC